MLKSQNTLQAAAKALSFRHLSPEQWRLWRHMMRRRPEWFILRQSGKRHERWHAVAGPFCSPEDARAALERLTGARKHRVRRNSERWQVASLPETMRIYHGNMPLLVEDLTTAETLHGSAAHACAPDHFALA